MPLAVRYIEPKHLCRRPLPVGTRNELQTVAQLSLVSVIQQIGSLAKHAESMMGELCDIISSHGERTLKLQQRVDHLKRKVLPRLEYYIQDEADNNIEVGLDDVQHYSSDHTISQQLLSIDTAPDSLKKQYYSSQKIPPLHQFTQHFSEGQNAVHLYSNPQFFFNSWRTEMERKATATSSSSKRRSTLLTQQQSSDNMMLEESIETPLPVLNTATKKRSKQQDTTFTSATLPLRIKPRNKKTKQQLQQAFSSMKKERQKERKAITNETFTSDSTSTTKPITTPTGGTQEHSESSGYMSQHSSSSTVSLVEQDNTTTTVLGNNNPLEKRSISTQCMVGSDVVRERPRVLNRTKSSSSLTRKNSSSHTTAAHSSPVTKPKEGGGSPKHTVTSPTKQSPLHTVPTVSPEIRHKTVDIIRSLSQSSPAPQGVRNSGVFSFPDPIEVLRNNPHLNVTSSFSLDEILSTDDLLSATNSQDSMKPSSISNWSPARPAPSPPTGPKRHHSVSSIIPTGSPEVYRPLKSRDSSQDNSPILERRESVLTPRRKAPAPPPSTGSSKNGSPLNGSPRTDRKQPSSEAPPLSLPSQPITGILRQSSNEQPSHQKIVKKLSTEKVVDFVSDVTNPSKNEEPKMILRPLPSRSDHHGNQKPEERHHSNSQNSPPTYRHRSNSQSSPPTQRRHSNILDSPPTQRHRSNTQVTPPTQRRHSNTKESPPTQNRHSNTQDSPPTQRRHSNTKESPPTQRRHSNTKTQPEAYRHGNTHHHGNQEVQSPIVPSSSPPYSTGKKIKGFFGRQSSQEAVQKSNNRKSTILKAAGVEIPVISNERNKLLSSIRKGIELKKVQERQRAVTSGHHTNTVIMPWDVAAILERRQALENSDNELDDGLVQDIEWEDM